MPDDDDEKLLLRGFEAPLTTGLMHHLTDALGLRFRIYPGDPIVAHRIIEHADEVPVMLQCIHLDDQSGYGIFVRGVGTERDSQLIADLQAQVDRALVGISSP